MAYCRRCEQCFNSIFALDQHRRDSRNHNLCCGTDFASWNSLKEHWVQSGNHVYCQYCNQHYDHLHSIEEHFESEHPYCDACQKVFTNAYGLQEHYRQSPRHHYCEPCNRLFQSESNLNAHLNSSVHRPKTVECRMGCGMTFVSHSAMVLHLEGGSCSSGMNRNKVNRFVRQHDTSNIITDPSRLLTGGSPDEESTLIATSASWNPYVGAFECCLCHSHHGTLRGLNQHLASPRHLDKIYICPGPDCESRFSALSALVQHIESDRCRIQRFSVVRRNMDRLFGDMRRLTFH